jgi:hypothetical protein
LEWSGLEVFALWLGEDFEDSGEGDSGVVAGVTSDFSTGGSTTLGGVSGLVATMEVGGGGGGVATGGGVGGAGGGGGCTCQHKVKELIIHLVVIWMCNFSEPGFPSNET